MRTRLFALALAVLAAPSAARGSEPLAESQQVTAFDLVVEIAHRREPGVALEPALGRDRFTLLWDEAPLPIVSLASGSDDAEPWRLVLYFDRPLSADPTVRWAAMELAERAGRLTGLGEVEVVVADPEPRRALAPTRDDALLDKALSGLFLKPEGGNQLVAGREEHLMRWPRAPAAPGAARRAARTESELVRRQLDRLLAWLVEAPPPTPRRALVLIADGFDLSPGDFYRGAAGDEPGSPGADLGPAIAELGSVLGAYGWIVAALAPPPPPVGTGRFGVFMVPDPAPPWLFTFSLRSIAVWLDRNRNVKKADAFAELGRSLRDQGELEQAVVAYGKSIYHYYDHPKSARRQAAALVGLGETHLLRGDRRRARQAFRAAVAFDESLAPSYPFVAARLLAPREPLERLAEHSAGRLVTEPAALDAHLGSLRRRVRLTSQLGGTPDGRLHEVELRLERPALLARHPRLARWGTPPAVTALRLRRLLDGEPSGGSLEVDLRPLPAIGGESGRLELTATFAAPVDANGRPAPLLVSWASGAPGLAPVYELRAETLEPRPGDASTKGSLTLRPAADRPWVAVVVEDPRSGAWGGALLERDEPEVE